MKQTGKLSGFIIVRRINWFRHPRIAVPNRKARLPGTHDEVLHRFRGIEGMLWPDEIPFGEISLNRGIAPVSQMEHLIVYYQELHQYSPHQIFDFLYCSNGSYISEVPESFKFRGYDYGNLICASNNYSIIYNEILYGLYDELGSLSVNLNESLLFPSIEYVEQASAIRARLLNAGADLETDDDFSAIAIYAPSRTWLQDVVDKNKGQRNQKTTVTDPRGGSGISTTTTTP
jgi:hypothetical protein